MPLTTVQPVILSVALVQRNVFKSGLLLGYSKRLRFCRHSTPSSTTECTAAASGAPGAGAWRPLCDSHWAYTGYTLPDWAGAAVRAELSACGAQHWCQRDRSFSSSSAMASQGLLPGLVPSTCTHSALDYPAVSHSARPAPVRLAESIDTVGVTAHCISML